MHSLLMRVSAKDERHRGNYKHVENNVAAFDRQGRQIGIVFETASAFETPRLMEELVQWANLQFSENKLPALITIGMFVVAFLAIHPFEDGNGRLSRALTVLLLLRAGYVYAPYSSLESVIEASKESYYVALRATQRTLGEPEPNWNIWMRYFLKALVKQVHNLKVKIEGEHLLKAMPEISLRIIELLRAHGTLSIAETERLIPINRNTLRAHFKVLTKDGYLIKTGKGPATRYALAAYSAERVAP